MDITFSSIDLIGVLLGIVASIDLVLLVVVALNRDRTSGSRFFVISAIFATIWVLSMFFFRLLSDTETLILVTKLLYITGILVTHFLLLFSYEFLSKEKNKIPVKIHVFVFVLTIPILLLITLTDTIISSVYYESGLKIVTFGILYIPYSMVIAVYLIIAYINFFSRAHKFKIEGKIIKNRQIIYIIFGTGIAIAFGFIFDIILPYFGNFAGYWLGPLMNILFVTATTYSILKHHLFDLKVIATELFIFSLWVIILTRVLTSLTLIDQFINIGVLLATIIIGALLIKSVKDEVQQRIKIERLADDLKKVNIRLKELDKLKSEFVSIASHQLRSPLTAIKGYASLLLEDSYGKIPLSAKEAIEKIFESTDLMVNSVEDFLNVSRIEQGKMKYDYSNFNIVELVKDVFDEQKNIADEKSIVLSFNSGNEKIIVKADLGKMKQVFTNLVDNAIKYTPKGSVVLSIHATNDIVRFVVKDTGVGLSKEDVNKLFTKFSRASDANRINVKGTGLGLYVAKQMILAHKGKIWVESEGKGLGSSFIVELPIN